jgi:hypothetical protein
MAGGARFLPKWQARANLVPNAMQNRQSKYRAKQNLFFD